MFFTKEGQTLYLSSWEYNATLIISEIKKIVLDNGGRVKESGNNGFIVNRTVSELINKARINKDTLTENINSGKVENNEKRQAYLDKMQDEINKLSAINNDPVAVSNGSYISFIFDNTYYYFQISDNPFFEHYFTKTPVVNGKYSKDACLEEMNTEWIFDSFFGIPCAEISEDRKEAANMIFNNLVTAKNSVKRIDSHRVRVSNTYNSGYHYETIKEKERFETITF